MYEIKHTVQGYYILTVNGEFYGSFDTYAEAARELRDEGIQGVTV